MSMTKRRGPQERSAARRREILDTALTSFAEIGFLETTMDDICRAANASIGSIYHHFGSKDELAAGVYLEGLTDYQEGFVAELERHSEAADGLRGVVHYHLSWVSEHPHWARFLFRMRRADFMTARKTEIDEMNKSFLGATSSWFRPHVNSGQIRRLPKELYFYLLVGPVQGFAREWLAGRTQTKLPVAAKELAQAAWRVLKGDNVE